VEARHRVHLAQPQLVELARGDRALWVVGLVGDNQHRLLDPPKAVRQVDIRRIHPVHAVRHEQDHVGLRQGHVRLHADLLDQRVFVAEQNPARVHQREAAAVPFRLRVQPIPRDAGAILDHCDAPPDDAVEERALADVRTADDHDDGAFRGHRGLTV